MRSIDQAVIHSVQHLERRNNRARRQHIDLDASARHFFDAGGIVACEVLPDIGVIP